MRILSEQQFISYNNGKICVICQVHSNIIHNSQKVKAIQTFITG